MKKGTARHGKMFDLAEKVGKDIPTCIGYLNLLWEATGDFAPQGDIGKFSDQWIEAACMWKGKRGRLVAALTASKWLDESSSFRLTVHGWSEHCEEWVKRKLQRAGLPFLSNHEDSEKVTGKNPVTDGEKPDTLRTDLGSTARALPSLALPSLASSAAVQGSKSAKPPAGNKPASNGLSRAGAGLPPELLAAAYPPDRIEPFERQLRLYRDADRDYLPEPDVGLVRQLHDAFAGDVAEFTAWLITLRAVKPRSWGLLIGKAAARKEARDA